MPGTFAEQAQLATSGEFINQCRAAMIFRAVQLVNSSAKQDILAVNSARTVMQNAGSGGDANNMALLVATGYPSIATQAPKAPTDDELQLAVNSIMDQLK